MPVEWGDINRLFNKADSLFKDAEDVFKSTTVTKTVKTNYEPLEVRFKKVSPNAVVPEFHTEGAAGFDLTTTEHVVVQPDSRALVSTGLVIAAPKGHMLMLTHRSSTPKKFGVHVLTGIVDEDYCGDEDVLGIQVQNFSDQPATIPMGSRIAQGVFVPVTRAKFVESEKMGKSRGGYGSTG